ncbi:MAG: DUF5683 domain-containing protein [Balneolaceae bacterium]
MSQSLEKHQQKITKENFVTPVLERSITPEDFGSNLQQTFTDQPGFAFLSSAIIPGSGQAVNKNWFRSGLYLAVEAVSIYFMLDYKNRGQRRERNYEQYVDQNWSVVQYANWIIDYHEMNGLNNPYLADLKTMMEGTSASFNTSIDWNKVDLELLRNAERNTAYIVTDNFAANNFSHTLPGYGSQQYYELVSKYYQFQSGWNDYYEFHQSNNTNAYQIDRNGRSTSPMFYEGVKRAQRFNDDFRFSKNLLSLLIANHFISAFDSYFTFKLKQNRIITTTSVIPGQQFQLRYNF